MKKLILLFTSTTILFYSQSLLAQASWTWAQGAGGIKQDEARCITKDKNDFVYITGFYSSASITFGTYTLHNSNALGTSSDMFLVKYDAGGTVIWAVSYGSSGHEEATGVAIDTSGYIYVTGSYTSPVFSLGSVTLINSDVSGISREIFLAKFDVLGNVVWAKTSGGLYEDVANSVSTDGRGNIFIAGNFESDSISFGATSIYTSGGADIFIIKFDAAGNVVWSKNAGGAAEEKCLSISADSLGNTAITGYFYSDSIMLDGISLHLTDTIGTDTLACDDIFTAKYDVNGNILWAKNAGGRSGYSDEVNSQSVCLDKFGNVEITGYFRYDTLYFSPTSYLLGTFGSRDIFIAKYDASGTLDWVKSAGLFLDDEGRGITTDAIAGDILVTGYYQGMDVNFDANALHNGSYDSEIFAVKFDTNGNVVWATDAGGSDGEYANSICSVGLNNVFVTGTFFSPIDTFDLINLNNNGIGDVFTARIFPVPVGVQQILNDDQTSFMVFPNPATNNAMIGYSLKKSSHLSIEIYNDLGAKINSDLFEGIQKEGKYLIPFSISKPGIYFVRMVTEDEIKTQKIIFTN